MERGRKFKTARKGLEEDKETGAEKKDGQENFESRLLESNSTGASKALNPGGSKKPPKGKRCKKQS